jgi:octaprenyl-diphosphate synthase
LENIRRKKTVLEKIKNGIKKELASVENRIYEITQNEFFLIENTIKHLVKAGGKRIRPIITLHCAKITGGIKKQHIDFAACVELIHISSLIHDDVVDNADARRNAPTLNKVWGNKIAVLIGDYIISRTLHSLIVDIDNKEILRDFSDIANLMTIGELQELSSNHYERNIDNYLSVIEKKTAKLFSIATSGSAILNKDSDTIIDQMKELGLRLGYIFQITDDIIDIESTKDEMGKEPLKDLEEGKITLPLLYFIAEDKQDIFKDLLDRFFSSNSDILKSEIIKELKNTNAISKTRKKAVQFAEEGIEILNKFENSESKQALLNLIEWVVERDY